MKILFTSFLILICSISFSQVGIGTTNPQAALDVTSTSNGVLTPRMTTTQRNAIASPSDGLLIFNTTTQRFNFYSTPNWIEINGSWTEAPNAAPVASNVNYSPEPALNFVLTGTYTYSDANNDLQGTSTFQWYRADDANGLNQVAIAGATSNTYTVVSADNNKYIGFGVTPKAQTGNLVGSEVIKYFSVPSNSSTPNAQFTFTSSTIRQLPFFHKNRTMSGFVNNIEVEVNITSPGRIIFSTGTVNGYSFSSNTIYTKGLKWISIPATGTQTSYSAGGDNFTLTGVGVVTETKNISIYNTLTGSDLTTFSNGATYNEYFSANSNCTNAPISASHTTLTCSGSVNSGSNSYNLVLVNGQCWTKQNMKEIPTAPCSSSPNSGCNVWTNVSQSTDVGLFGFYNNVVTNGSSGWRVNEPSFGEGYLYQWSAMMNGSTQERSKGICPVGFHIPSDCEYAYLEHGLGMDITSQNQVGGSFRPNGNIGLEMKNISGLNWKLTGSRNPIGGSFSDRNTYSFDWSSSLAGNNTAWRRGLVSTSPNSLRINSDLNSAFTVRCIKD